MGIDTSRLQFPKGQLRVEAKRAKRLTQAELERDARAIVQRRDKGKCVVPGCKERGAHLHHIVFRSQSKRKRWLTGNLCLLCPAHHSLLHAGRITISGDANEHLDIRGSRKDLAFKL